MSLLFAFISLISCSFSNEPEVVKIEDQKTFEIIASLTPEKYYFSQDFYLSIHRKRNPPGSGSEGTHDASESFYLVVNEGEDSPIQTVFEVGPFYSPKVKEIREGKDLIEVDVQYFFNMERTTLTMVIGPGVVSLRK